MKNAHKQYIACISYGKDSIVLPELCVRHNLPLDRIVTVDVWATPDIPGDFPQMVEWKAFADEEIFKKYGIKVEHIKASKSYAEYFYNTFAKGKREGNIYGFPYGMGAWCNSRLKLIPLKQFDNNRYVQYLGICSDEPERIERTVGTNRIALPAQLGYSQDDTRNLAAELNLLSPTYENSQRGGAGFATIRVLDSYGCCEKTTLNYGNCCSSGIATALHPLSVTGRLYAILTGALNLKTVA